MCDLCGGDAPTVLTGQFVLGQKTTEDSAGPGGGVVVTVSTWRAMDEITVSVCRRCLTRRRWLVRGFFLVGLFVCLALFVLGRLGKLGEDAAPFQFIAVLCSLVFLPIVLFPWGKSDLLHEAANKILEKRHNVRPSPGSNHVLYTQKAWAKMKPLVDLDQLRRLFEQREGE